MTTSSGITTLGNRTFFFGGASGIDTSALITAAYNAKKLESTNLDTKISKNTTKIASYSQLQTLSQAVQTALKNIKKSYSVLDTGSSLFDARSGTLTSSSSTSASNLLDVTVASGTALGSYSLEIQQKAMAQKVAGNTATTDKTAALGVTGSFDIGAAGSTAATINVTSSMSLSDVAAAINAQSTTTGVGASVIKASSSGYQLVLTANQTNKTMSVTNITGTNVLQNLGVLNSSGGFVNQIQPAQGAIVKLDGTPVTRDTNNFSDLIDGVSLTVKNAEPGTTVQLKVDNDTSSIESGVRAFVDAYNSFRDFITTNQKVTNGVVSSDAVLFGDFTMKSLGGDIQSLLGAQYGSSSASLRTLREVGITIDGDNHLQLDSVAFNKALTNNFDDLKSLFQAQNTSDNSNFRMTGNTSKLTSSSFAMDITYSGGTISSVSVGGDSSLFDISGATITGKKGTAYEGMSFAYIGTTSTTVNFSMTQGLADRMYNRFDLDANTVGGTIQSLKTSLDNQNTKMSERSARVLQRADDFRQKLIDKYASFESKIAAAQTTLTQIQAVLNAKNNN